MIVSLFINFVILVIGAIFSFLPVVTTLPTIGGFDIDAALVTGIGQFNTVANAFWPLYYVFLGFLALLVYFAVKIGIRFFLGHRAPGSQ